MRPWWPGTLQVEEFGALDGLSRDAINGLAPKADDPRLVSRLADGSEVTLRAEAVHERVHAIVERCDRSNYDFLVLLCTGKFDALRSKHLLLKAQPIVRSRRGGLRDGVVEARRARAARGTDGVGRRADGLCVTL